jgi:hypothetical protein
LLERPNFSFREATDKPSPCALTACQNAAHKFIILARVVEVGLRSRLRNHMPWPGQANFDDCVPIAKNNEGPKRRFVAYSPMLPKTLPKCP